jgi:hypothetical protein
MEYPPKPNMRIHTAASEDPEVIRIEVTSPLPIGALAVERLINTDQDPKGVVYAGHHAGMPLQDVWAFAPPGEKAADYLDTIVADVQRAVSAVEPSYRSR